MPQPNLTLYSLQASRSIRIAWLLEELGLPYENHSFERLPTMKAPAGFSEKSRSPLGKAPALWDGEVVVVESGAITEYLLDKYDAANKLSGRQNDETRQKVSTFIHAAEGTFMVHCLAITYARAFAPAEIKTNGLLEQMEKGMAVNVGKNLDWLEGELSGDGERKERFLVGIELTAADTMVLFSIQYIFAKNLCAGRKVVEWPRAKEWIERCEARDGYKRAVEITGFKL